MLVSSPPPAAISLALKRSQSMNSQSVSPVAVIALAYPSHKTVAVDLKTRISVLGQRPEAIGMHVGANVVDRSEVSPSPLTFGDCVSNRHSVHSLCARSCQWREGGISLCARNSLR